MLHYLSALTLSVLSLPSQALHSGYYTCRGQDAQGNAYQQTLEIAGLGADGIIKAHWRSADETRRYTGSGFATQDNQWLFVFSNPDDASEVGVIRYQRHGERLHGEWLRHDRRFKGSEQCVPEPAL